MGLSTKYHIVPGVGAQPCTANIRTCKYQEHYKSFETADGEFQKQERARQKVQVIREKSFREKIQSLKPEEKIAFDVNLNHRGMDGAQAYLQMWRNHQKTGCTPQWVDARVRYLFKSDKGTPVYFIAEKKHQVDYATERVIGSWRFTARTDTGHIIADKEYRLMGTQEGRELKKGLSSLLSEATSVAYANNMMAKIEKSRVADGLLNVMYSAESLERGAQRADALGFSFFKGSDKENLVAHADWGETVFTPEMVDDALHSPQYERNMPKVQIHIQESLNKTLNENSVTWALHTDNGRVWRIQKIRGNTSTWSPEYTDPKECGLALTAYIKQNMPEYAQERANLSGGYAHDLIDGLNKVLDANKARIDDNIRQWEKRMATPQKKGFFSKILGN